MTKQTPDDHSEQDPVRVSGRGSESHAESALAQGVDAVRAPSVLKQMGERIGSRPTVRLREIDEASGEPIDGASVLEPFRGGEDTRDDAGRYKVLGLLGQGGVGAVHRGHDSDLGRDVAMKFLHERYAKEPSVLHRFVEEAQIGGQLQHPGIVPVYELGIADGKPFFTMKMVKGETLAKKLSERVDSGADRRKFLVIFEDICQTMAYAHARGVVHRDLKPANIMIGAFGEVQVVDWGMGKVMSTGGVADELRSVERHSQVSVIETARSSGHGTQSVMGSVMGTPAYMPPEQARGDVDAMDERSDVFALGAILCEILTGQPPYVGAQSELISMAALAKLDDARARLTACDADADLVELATLCLMPSPSARPQSADHVAKAVLKNLAAAEERVHAETMRAISLKRTQKLGVTLTAVIAVGLAASLWFWTDAVTARGSADEQRGLADKQREHAVDSETKANQASFRAVQERENAVASKEQAKARIDNFTRLSYVVQLRDVKAAERDLYPAAPEALAMRSWLARAEGLRKQLPDLRETRTRVRAEALPANDKKNPAVVGRLQKMVARHAVLVTAQAVRSGEQSVEEVVLEESLPKENFKLFWAAFGLSGEGYRELGQEARGLALARLVLDRAPKSGDGRVDAGVLLAWSLFANGLDDKAIAQLESTLKEAGDGARSGHIDSGIRLHRAVDEAKSPRGKAKIEALGGRIAALEVAVASRWQWQFEKEPDQFLHDTLTELIEGIEALKGTIDYVTKQLLWAETVTEVTVTKHSARWSEAKLAITAANGVTASKLYAAHPFLLKPQRGLVPIGMNPKTLLWEFYHLKSAWDGVLAPKDIVTPTHGANGTIAVSGATGIVFVLLPGGAFTMGSQWEDPAGDNYYLEARLNEPVREVNVKPFFLARHELTQGQWARMWHGDPPGRQPSSIKSGQVHNRQSVTLANPVETVTWGQSDELLNRQGLTMPTEAQWEYSCRSFTTTPWTWDRVEMHRYANFLDESQLGARNSKPGFEPWDDKHQVHAPVGKFEANPFGLHDMQGNVWELTRTEADASHGVSGGAPWHLSRGGSWNENALGGRSSIRRTISPTAHDPSFGVRAARSIDV